MNKNCTIIIIIFCNLDEEAVYVSSGHAKDQEQEPLEFHEYSWIFDQSTCKTATKRMIAITDKSRHEQEQPSFARLFRYASFLLTSCYRYRDKKKGKVNQIHKKSMKN